MCVQFRLAPERNRCVNREEIRVLPGAAVRVMCILVLQSQEDSWDIGCLGPVSNCVSPRYKPYVCAVDSPPGAHSG